MCGRKVWAIYYKVRGSSKDSWRRHEWVGPCGVGVIQRDIDLHFYECLLGRPFFFRTRALARQKAKELMEEKNITWFWVKYTVRPFTLSWTEGD